METLQPLLRGFVMGQQNPLAPECVLANTIAAVQAYWPQHTTLQLPRRASGSAREGRRTRWKDLVEVLLLLHGSMRSHPPPKASGSLGQV